MPAMVDVLEKIATVTNTILTEIEGTKAGDTHEWRDAKFKELESLIRLAKQLDTLSDAANERDGGSFEHISHGVS